MAPLRAAETDAQPTMDPLMHSYDAVSGRGEENAGRFADPVLDALITAAATQADPALRKDLVRRALLLHHSQLYHLVLHRQMLTWAMRRNVDATPAANNHMRSWLVRMKPDSLAVAGQ